MKIGVIADLLRTDWRQAPAAAARIGVDGIQMGAFSERWNLCEFTAPERQTLLRECRSCGLEITALCGDIPGSGFDDDAAIPGRLRQTRRILDIAAALTCPVVTSHIGVIPSVAGSERRRMQDALGEVAEYARQRGVTFAIETGPESAACLREFLDTVASPGLKINFDPANLVMVLDADVVAAVELLGSDIVHTHAKDGRHLHHCDPIRIYRAFAEGGFAALLAETGELFREEPLGKGAVPFDAYLNALERVGYDGYLTIEREVGADPVADMKLAVEFLRARLRK